MAVIVKSLPKTPMEPYSDDFASHINKLNHAVAEAVAEFEIIVSPLIRLKKTLSLKQDNQPLLEPLVERLSVTIGKTHQSVSETQQNVHALARLIDLLKSTQNTSVKANEDLEESNRDISMSRLEELLNQFVSPLDALTATKSNSENITMLLTSNSLSKDQNNIKSKDQNNIKIAMQTKKASPQQTIFSNIPLAEQLSIDRKQLKDKLEQLYSKWSNPKNKLTNTEGYILLTNFIIKNLNNALTLSMLADDVNHFKKNFQEENGDILCLEFCCLCGSEKIIDTVYLQDPVKIKCLILSEQAIAYALSSGNEKLMLRLATKGAELAKKDPGYIGLYCFGNYKAVKNIQEIFTSTNIIAGKNTP
jgi:hypothetical protein